MSDWKTIDTAPEGVPVRTIISEKDGLRNDQVLTHRGNLWWTSTNPAEGIYVYYTPAHWCEL